MNIGRTFMADNITDVNQYFLKDGSPDYEAYESFRMLMTRYASALKEVRTKCEILNDELSCRSGRNPIENIVTRIKSPSSISGKLKRLGIPFSVDNICDNLNDVAGIRVICPFVDDIYSVADMLARQDDVKVITVKDYIKKPKLNGYRSYHMIVEIPVFFSDEVCPTRVEIQLRTVAMDFWASLEHRLKYKKGNAARPEIESELKSCAEVIAATDARMLGVRKRIEALDEGEDKHDGFLKFQSLGNGF